MSGFCTSGYAFCNYMDRDDEKMLYKAYRAAGMKRFHSMHAATMREGGATVFYSYYTELARYFYCEHSDRYCLVVSPFTYDAAKYCKSVTSARQLNKWILNLASNLILHAYAITTIARTRPISDRTARLSRRYMQESQIVHMLCR